MENTIVRQQKIIQAGQGHIFSSIFALHVILFDRLLSKTKPLLALIDALRIHNLGMMSKVETYQK